MVTRIHDMPVYATRCDEVQPSLYNLWRRARLHDLLPLRFDLPGMLQMTLIIEQDCWVVVDQNQYDLPVMAWVDFQDEHRDSLHTAVTCTINYYHYLANQLQGKILQLMTEYLQTQLDECTEEKKS